MLNHAKMFRGLTDLLPNRPAVMVSCHPTKASEAALVPRGGSSFFNEIDTNLTVERREGTTIADLHWAEKIRGIDFAPLPFELRKGQTEKLTDAKGRKIWSVTASPITEALATNIQDVNEGRAMEVLSLLVEDASLSFTAIAEHLKWSYPDGGPNKSLVQRLVNSLAEQRMIEKGPPRRVMPKGRRALSAEAGSGPRPQPNRQRPGEDHGVDDEAEEKRADPAPRFEAFYYDDEGEEECPLVNSKTGKDTGKGWYLRALPSRSVFLSGPFADEATARKFAEEHYNGPSM